MALVQASALGIDRFANDRNRESWSYGSEQDTKAIVRAVYQQVLGQQYVMASERLNGAESLFRNGVLNVRELVRTVAKSGLYRSRFFENCNPYRFIELNHKHLLGRAPQNKAEMLHHFTILQEQGYDAEIDSYIDSDEYQERFGLDVVPYLHGWDYSKGHEGRQFSWLMQLARGAAASVKGDSSGTQFRLGKALHQDKAVPVRGAGGRVVIVSTEGPFKALVSNETGISSEFAPEAPLRAPSQEHRVDALRVSAGESSSGSGRVVTISATGLVNNDYVRSGAYVMRVPFSRMNEALQRVNRLGGRVTNVVVS
ncbi:phycobilisome rod-core linker polypeptide [Synechococcus sp. Cruz-9H2]|uniref:phycobilisome rod-core linker polypeptide n=1 Tax=unclassified Synechococcus TaxID=2626047 RepID=UPI0020CF71FA|nr:MULTISPECIES: phycobilisome rod-core linker polypeptide [unclassified Synechococcus]MCP9818513.1 phycobilisome rod-core linker polypeptide [Synechococcus sp. Cruz-9H2]MCP9842744.1 phycobilisome rod-core linker polypeptide [Synechococcus sp. Edmonson 11F2]MCP9855409.1 phycobilisome rod-core linker polypeptide [Synechococcus sp. Cruz-9C9]MCP9862344.1 phycobilisome rod-core linker polypeptide [Synechococcus sp. Cruz-7E5]MCP9869616.1 phycobilisome rod-core linker polypeptide [Synechococcus sp. 